MRNFNVNSIICMNGPGLLKTTDDKIQIHRYVVALKTVNVNLMCIASKFVRRFPCSGNKGSVLHYLHHLLFVAIPCECFLLLYFPKFCPRVISLKNTDKTVYLEAMHVSCIFCFLCCF